MPKVLVVGGGMMGQAVVRDLGADAEVEGVVVADRDRDRLEACKRLGSPGKIATEAVEVSDREALVRLMRRFRVAVSAVAEKHALDVVLAAIEAGTNLVEMGASGPEKRLELDGQARAAGVTIVPGCGLAPGLSNILAGRGASSLERVEEIIILVGGLPQEPRPPLGYRILYSFDTLVDMSSGKARVVRDGKLMEVDALSELERVEFPPPVGECECFITDGLSTLPYTLGARGVKRLEEKTVRYPGHREKLKTLVDCGFFGLEPVRVGEADVVPREFSRRLLEPVLVLGEGKDLVVMRVDVSGRAEGKAARYRYSLVDLYDEELRMTSMARTTAYTCAVACRMVWSGMISGSGVMPPELCIGGEARAFAFLIRELARRGVIIQEERVAWERAR